LGGKSRASGKKNGHSGRIEAEKRLFSVSFALSSQDSQSLRG
jgi:hypothetical protein